MIEAVARLTRIRLEGTATTEAELRDYLTSCMENHCHYYGRVWEQRDPMEVVTTKNGYWGRVTMWRKDVPENDLKRVMQ